MQLRLLALAPLLFAPSALAQPIVVHSPDTAQTYALSSILDEHLRRLPDGGLTASITCSNVDYESRTEPRRDERFDFLLPGVYFNPRRNGYFLRVGSGKEWPVAVLKTQFIGQSMELCPDAQIIVAKRHGRVSVTLLMRRSPTDPAWIETAQSDGILGGLIPKR